MSDALLPEPPPVGLPESLLDGWDPRDGAPALLDVVGELTALGHQAKLQGKAFARLEAKLEESVAEARAAVEARAAREGAALGALLEDLLDLRDRLERCVVGGREVAAATRARVAAAEAAAAPAEEPAAAGGWLARLFAGRPVQAGLAPVAAREAHEAIEACVRSLLGGVELVAERLDDALRRRDVRPIATEGAAFDGKTMRAIERREKFGVAAGTVLETLRPGYRRGAEVLRVADVVVAAPGAVEP